MSYVDAFYDSKTDTVKVVERNNKGKRVFQEYPVKPVFYYEDPKGKHTTIYGDKVTRIKCKNSKQLRKEIIMLDENLKKFETDLNPVFVCLSENYINKDAPKLNVAFFDLEVDFDPKRGYAPPDDAFMPITAISIYLQWLDSLICLAIPPKTLTMDQAKELIKDFDNTELFDNEADLLKTFLDLIQDADVLSGWNSEGFDIPYTVNRISKTLTKDDTRKLCLWDQFPKRRKFERYGKESVTYDIVGRVHMDYMQLYRKYTYEERHSYSLDAIGEYELHEHKIAYEGSLDQLYNNDFETFIEYNRQDTALLAKLDSKLKFLELACELAHDNTVLLPTTMGAVAVSEQAIINQAHLMGLVVGNRKPKDEHGDTQAAGAYVAYPKKGMHRDIGAVDLNSLYPSAIRALNMGPETIVAQLRPTLTDKYIADKMAVKGTSFAKAWEGLFSTLEYAAVMNQEIGTDITIDWENGTSTIASAAEIFALVFETKQPWMLSANGTIFTYERDGIIPSLLKRWYSERKELQKKKKDASTPEDIAFWDKRQLVKKINLNSLYGAVLNASCRFFDKRMGQSTTLCGRMIAKHMDAFINECITGEYDHSGDAIIYGDTDSCFFSAWPAVKDDVESGKLKWDRDTIVKLYDNIADQVNDSFPGMMERSFHVPERLGNIIRCGRELVASNGIFITKKRYAVLIYDLDGERYDLMDGDKAIKKGAVPNIGKVKAMGLDLKRSDTPKIVQNFLSDILLDVLTGHEREYILEKIKDFKHKFVKLTPWEKGTPKRVNNLTKFTKLEEEKGKANLPGHVRAAVNWNTLKRVYNDRYSMGITDGAKVIVCKLKPNPIGFTSIAYPIDELRLPEWFKELPFDHDEMEAAIIDKKISNLIGILDWDLSVTIEKNNYDELFG